MSAPPSDLVLRPAWRQKDRVLERDARGFWQELNLLPEGTAAEERLEELCAVAYLRGAVAAVSTAHLQDLSFLRARLAMYRCAVSPDARSHQVATLITLFSRDLLERWSLDHPEEKLMGLGAVVQSRMLVENQREAIWPDTKFVFIGYTPAGHQMRVFWFEHARLSTYWPEAHGSEPVT